MRASAGAHARVTRTDTEGLDQRGEDQLECDAAAARMVDSDRRWALVHMPDDRRNVVLSLVADGHAGEETAQLDHRALFLARTAAGPEEGGPVFANAPAPLGLIALDPVVAAFQMEVGGPEAARLAGSVPEVWRVDGLDL